MSAALTSAMRPSGSGGTGLVPSLRLRSDEGEVLEAVVTKRRNKAAALKFLRKLLKRCGKAYRLTTDRLPSYRAALKTLGICQK